MQAMPLFVRKLFLRVRDNLRNADFPQSGELTQAPLLGSAEIADLRRRALNLIAYQSGDKAVLHKQHGEHLSPRRGVGLDYEESRVYQPGDEVRFMNWRLTARTEELYVKVFREERRPSAFILLDWRTGMRFGTRVRLKAAQALRSAVMLACYNDSIGRALSGVVINDGLQGGLRWLKTSSAEHGLMAMIDSMNQACPPQPPNTVQPQLAEILRAVHSLLTLGSHVYLISDFMDATEDCRAMLAQLSAEHEVNAVHIVDPAEQQLPSAGNLRLSGPEEKQASRVDTSNPQTAAQYQNAARQYLEERESLLRGLGIGYSRLITTVDNIESELAFT